MDVYSFIIRKRNDTIRVITADEKKGKVLMDNFSTFISKSNEDLESIPVQHRYTFNVKYLDYVKNTLEKHGHQVIAF